ncbi:MAG: hypothetical protein P8X57_07635, partial [Cyclobacteriaceae bacterium]
IIFGALSPLKADIVFPARLELKQIDENTYDIIFTLPVIKGRVLRATPVIPCSNITEPKITIDNFAKTMTWRVNCSDLIGEEVGLDGLGGNQVDILLRIEFLNGRVVESTLSPVKPLYIVPPPPTALFISKTGFSEGIREFLSRVVLLVLVLILFPIASIRTWLIMGGTFLAGVFTGIVLKESNLLVFQEQYLYTILLTLVSINAIRRFTDKLPSFSGDWYACAVLTGLIGGSGITLPNQFSGLAPGELGIWLAGVILGVGAGVIMLIVAGHQLSRARELRRDNDKGPVKWLWIFTGIVACSMLVYDLTLYLSVSPPPLMLTTFIFLLIAPALINSKTWRIPVIMGIAFTGGIAGSMMEIPTLIYMFPVFGILWFIITRSISFKRNLLIDSLAGMIGAFATGWITAADVVNSLSYPEANLIGIFILVSFILTLIYMQISIPEYLPAGFAYAGILIVAVYLIEIKNVMITDWNEFTSLGRIPLPVITIVLLILALFLIPRKRKIHQEMDLGSRSSGPALIILGLALIALPFGWVGVASPWSSGEMMTDREARSVLDNTLSNVYTAFNIDDEDELFEQLSNNVDEQLIDQIYLDSRRRLNAGVREGAQVTVQDIDILEITPKENSGNDQLFEATWVVTARVKHLQHVHHRKNKYIGDITLRASDNNWKIAQINLTSEDRTIVPVSSL